MADREELEVSPIRRFLYFVILLFVLSVFFLFFGVPFAAAVCLFFGIVCAVLLIFRWIQTRESAG